MGVPIKSTNNASWEHQSDAFKGYVRSRTYRSLLRSTGHLFRDGRWDGQPDSFHAYREIENPGFGPLLTYQAGAYHKLGLVEPPEGPDPITFNWRSAVSRSYIASDSTGDFEVELPSPVDPEYTDSVLELNALGTSYIRRFRPGNPVASLGEFIIELRNLPRIPALLNGRAKKFRDLGSDYLNVEFGWKPFVSDLIQLYRTQMTISDRLNRLIRNNGIQIKRRSKHEETISDLSYHTVLNRPWGDLSDPSIGGHSIWEGYRLHGPVPFGYYDSFVSGGALISKNITEKVNTWFVGTFFYYVPDIGSDRWTRHAKDVLFGLNPTPEQIYRTYPWTWLIDWFANVGDIVSNLANNAVDNEVFTDCFVMKQTNVRDVISATSTWGEYVRTDNNFPALNFHLPSGSASLSSSFIKVEKLRRQASPFGFGLKSGDFTFRQISIIAALLNVSARKPALLSYWRGALS